jgi:DNA-binding NarL/FixJ family response regulator
MTKRDEVAALIAEGMSDKEIAGRLGISHKTVEYHVGLLIDNWQLDRKRNVRVQITRHVLTRETPSGVLAA